MCNLMVVMKILLKKRGNPNWKLLTALHLSSALVNFLRFFLSMLSDSKHSYEQGKLKYEYGTQLLDYANLDLDSSYVILFERHY